LYSGLPKGVNKGHYATTKRGFIHTVVIVEHYPMTGRSVASSITGLLIFTILLLWSSNVVSADDGDFDISEGNIWSFDYLDGVTMQSSGNISASDGDYVNLVIPVSNSTPHLLIHLGVLVSVMEDSGMVAIQVFY